MSAIKTQDTQLHFDEVVGMQEFIMKHFRVSMEARNKAISYREYLRQYFSLKGAEFEARISEKQSAIPPTVPSEEDKGMSLHQALDLCPKFAGRHQVSPAIHPKDFIFQFVIENKVFDTLEAAVAYYFDDGARSAEKLRSLLQEVCGWQFEPIKLLEFASGYGCVTRHLTNILPEATVTSCDIHQDAVQFISEELGVNAVISSSIPEHLSVPDEYDIVFALSFFSHMPKATWTRWFNTLLSKVKKGGFLIFTTHGWLSRKYFGFPEFDDEGFWFARHSEQKDLDTSEYGMAVLKPSFVIEQAAKNPAGSIVFSREGYWWEHQDLYVVKHESSPGHRDKETNIISQRGSPPDFDDDDLVPPLELICDGSASVTDFKEVGEGITRFLLLERARLRPNEKVLDVGCGIGRIARPLTKYLSEEGVYEGFDIVSKGISWCREKYKAYPNFHFKSADIFNKHYNPAGKIKSSEFKFDCESETFDVVSATSVFTHMLPRDMENYLKEIARVLKPHGRCMITYFLLNPESLACIDAKLNTIGFPFEYIDGICRVADRDIPEFVVAYDEKFIRDLYIRQGLGINEIIYGFWSGRKDFLNSLQDVIIAVK